MCTIEMLVEADGATWYASMQTDLSTAPGENKSLMEGCPAPLH